MAEKSRSTGSNDKKGPEAPEPRPSRGVRVPGNGKDKTTNCGDDESVHGKIGGSTSTKHAFVPFEAAPIPSAGECSEAQMIEEWNNHGMPVT